MNNASVGPPSRELHEDPNVEKVHLKEYLAFNEARRNIKQFIEEVHNTKRLHSALTYKAPNELEAEGLNIR